MSSSPDRLRAVSSSAFRWMAASKCPPWISARVNSCQRGGTSLGRARAPSPPPPSRHPLHSPQLPDSAPALPAREDLTWTQEHTAGRNLYWISLSASRAEWMTARLSSSSRTLRLSGTKHTGSLEERGQVPQPHGGTTCLPPIMPGSAQDLIPHAPETDLRLERSDFGGDHVSLTLSPPSPPELETPHSILRRQTPAHSPSPGKPGAPSP